MPDDRLPSVNANGSSRSPRPSAPVGPVRDEIRCLVDPLTSRCRGGILLRATGPTIDPAPAQRRPRRPETAAARNADSRAA